MHWSEDGLILKTLGGSRAYGLNTPTSDMDYRGVALPPPRWLVGFPPGDYAGQTAERKTQSDDVVVHTLQKFCSLALKGSPNILEVLFCRDEEVAFATIAGWQIREMRDAFLSRHVYASLSGYAFAQLKRMRNHNTRHGIHEELINRYGYDTKNAMHLIRLLLMGKEILSTGELHVYRPDREYLLSIRNGAYTAHQLQTMAEEMDAESLKLCDTSPLPEKPDRERIESWLVEVQTRWVMGDRTLLSPS